MGKFKGIIQVSAWIVILVVPIAFSAEKAMNEESNKELGVEPSSKNSCPSTHPIKGNFTTHSGERCIYHMPGQRFYNKTQPERCYESPGEAEQDGCRASKV